MGARAGMSWRPRAACTSIVSVLRRICLPHMSQQGEVCLKQTVDMDDEDGRCLLDVICDPQALNDFLHGSETHLDTDDLLDGSADPASSFFSGAGVLMPQVQPSNQLSVTDPSGLPSSSVDLDFLEDDDILGGGSREGGSSGMGGANHEPCDILQQSLAEANITEQSLQEAEAELDLGSFCLPGLTQVVQTLPDPSLPGAGGPAAVGVHLGGQIFHSPTPNTTTTPPNTAPDMIGSVLAHPGLQLQPQVMNKSVTVQPFMQPVGLGNVTLQPISSLQALPNGSQSGHLGIGQIQVMGQPTVMAINQSGQPILTKTMSGYQLHQAGPDVGSSAAQAGLSGSVLGSGGGLLIQGGKPALGSPALNGASVAVGGVAVSVNSTVASSGSAITSSGGLVGFGGASLGVGTPQQTPPPGQIMQNIVIQRTPTPIQPKPPQGGAVQHKLYKQHHMQQQPQQQQQQQPPGQQLPAPNSLQNETGKGIGVPQGQVPVSAAQSVAFLTGKHGANVVLSTQAGPQGSPFPQALFKQQGPHATGKPLSVHLLNQSGSIVIPSHSLQGQNHPFLLPQLQAGGQILAQHPGGHIIASQGPGGQIIANQILATNQNLNLGQVPVSLAQTQTQAHSVAGHTQAVIQGMPIQNSLAMLGQVEGLGPAVSLQPPLAPPPPPSQQQAGIIPLGGGVPMAQCQPTDSVSVVGGTVDQPSHLAQAPPPASLQPPPPSILTVQTAPSSSISISVPSSSSPSPSSSSSSSIPPASGALAPPLAQHSPGKLFLAPQGSGMFLSQESLQMFLQQDQKRQSESEPRPLGCVPASVIVSSGSGSGPAHSGHNSLSDETGPAQSPTHSHGPTLKAAVVHQIPSTGHQQQLKIQSVSPSQPVAALPTADSPQPSQASPIILGQPIHSPHPPQPQSQAPTPSRSCTPSSLPPLFIIHNQIGGSPQPAPQTQPPSQPQQPQIQTQIQPQPCPPTQPVPFQQDLGVASVGPSHSTKPPAALPVQFQFAPTGGAVVQSLTVEQQQSLQLVGAQLQTLSAITQPSAQQKQLLEKLHQVQQNIILQAKQQTAAQPAASNQFSSPQDPPTSQPVTSSTCTTTPAQLASLLQQTSVLVKTPSTGSSEVKLFSGASGPATATAKQGVSPVALTQSVQLKPGGISSVGGVAVGTAALQIQVLGSGISQLATPQSAAAIQTQATALKIPFAMEPSKEAKTLEQLRKQQGSVLRPDFSAPFHSFEDSVHRLLPYHVYQGTLSTTQDFYRVDEEFQSVSSQLLKRTQAMVDKYRLLLFEESKRLGPSAEMVMIDRMFIQEEKMALNQDRVLAKDRPEEYVAHSCSLESAAANLQLPLPAESGTAKAGSLAVGGGASAGPPPALATPHFTPTKLVIKHGGGGASVSWSTSITPGGASRLSTESAGQSLSIDSSAPSDDDALPQRSSKPPMKTYEARRRIGLKLKIKQEAGLTKVVHNTALDPVHMQKPRHNPTHQPPTAQQQPVVTVPPATTVIRTPPLDSSHSVPTSSSTPTVTIATTPPTCPAPSSTSSTSFSSSSSAQVNGTLEHHHHTPKRNPPGLPPVPTCRLPLRKTYRENVSPPRAPLSPHTRDPASTLPERTVIASVKLEKRGGGTGRGQLHTDHGAGPGPEAGGGTSNAQLEGESSPGLMKELAEVEEVFYRGMIKNTHRRHQRQHTEPGEGHGGMAGEGGGTRSKRSSGKSRERGGDRSSRRDGPAPTSPAGSHHPWDPSLPTKRRKSDSPDMDNASFSSGSPPPDDSLSEHLQSAIDSILNLQQGAPTRGGSSGRAPGAHPSQQPSAHRAVAPSTSSNRLPTTSSSSSSSLLSQRSQHGSSRGRGHNGSFVSRTYSR
ncbi:hypothetical protein SKAU_G00087060 [Synaphobranchus kaupii]|uniref:GLTSCR protein conserved domain-containing protein n=1 Tax=Synaphobranchus kaupii TaxID=118154 RepID=A0A9Q1FVS2_SYNKA|nr:hypothetical protein SKAU_G00087060 [Synaphobranchus kaupii]